MLQLRMRWPSDDGAKRFTAYYDCDYRAEGSFAYDTPEETQAAVDDTNAHLETGEWIAIGITIEDPCPNTGKCCEQCDGWEEIDSCWGIVIEDNDDAIKSFAKEMI